MAAEWKVESGRPADHEWTFFEETHMKVKNTNKPATRSFLGTMLAVAWSFIGLRRRKDFEQDVGGLNPVYVLIAGLLGTAMLIGTLLTVVHLVVS